MRIKENRLISRSLKNLPWSLGQSFEMTQPVLESHIIYLFPDEIIYSSQISVTTISDNYQWQSIGKLITDTMLVLFVLSIDVFVEGRCLPLSHLTIGYSTHLPLIKKKMSNSNWKQNELPAYRNINHREDNLEKFSWNKRTKPQSTFNNHPNSRT